jgi:hypothetical protein
VSVNLGGMETRDVRRDVICEVGHCLFLTVTSKNEQKTTMLISTV